MPHQNVLIVSTYFPPHIGGVEVVAQQQARSLAQAGHTVVVATTRSEATMPRRDHIDGYDVIRLPAINLLERRTGVPYPFISPALGRGLRRLIGWCDLVHVHDVLYQPAQVAALLAGRAGKPLYLTQHIGRPHHPNRVVLALAHLSATVAGGYLWRRARRVVAHNPLVADYLLEKGVPADRIVTAPNGIDTAHFTPRVIDDNRRRDRLRDRLGLPADRPLVLFVGRLMPQKGYQHLIGAADEAYHVVLAGSGRPERRLPDGVSWIGPVPREELADLYRLADVFALPSVGEFFPLVVQEAMACGLPIVATDDYRYDSYDVDRERISLVRPEPDQLRQAISAIVAEPELGRKMSEYSRQFAVAHFDWQTNQRTLLGIYDHVRPAGASRCANSPNRAHSPNQANSPTQERTPCR